LAQTTYTVTVSNLGCSDIAAATVHVNIPQPVEAGNDTTILHGESVQLHASGGVSWTWSPGSGLDCTDCSSPVASPEATTTYSVIAIDINGCVSTDNVTVLIDNNCGDVFLPTVFSPNGDGINDVFYARGNCIEKMTFFIYDRWGERVYESTDPHEGWDGNFRGQAMGAGVFTYYIKLTLFNGNDIRHQGTITLVR
jgi:gliding motility-associated-like protein